ncbi:hypothetical protein C8R47DRAFT_1207657 [Mycena vitilis]|nr:hypothetical protein C8R47DRAFT_1207657 [Mycena vitilis]
MATLVYIDVPASASRLMPQSQRDSTICDIRRAPKIVTSLPHPRAPAMHRRTDSASSLSSITSPVNLLPQLLLSSLPLNPPQQAGYAFFCYFPRLLSLLPQMMIIGISLATHPETTHKPPPAPEAPAESGSVDWRPTSRLSRIPWGSLRTLKPRCSLTCHQPQTANPRSPHSPGHIAVPRDGPGLFPLSQCASYASSWSIAPLLLSHPIIRPRGYPTARQGLRQRLRVVAPVLEVAGGVRLIDDANLTDECWVAEKREVELFENERFGGDDTHKEWSKANLRDGERTGWTRGGTGGAASGQGGVSSNLTFSLDPGWAFVTTEDWRADLEARRARQGGARTADDEGVLSGGGGGGRPCMYFYSLCADDQTRRLDVHERCMDCAPSALAVVFS